MTLTDEQYKSIEDLAGISYSPKQIALYLDVPLLEFMDDFNDPDSKIRYHFDRGALISQADIDMKTLKQAKDGNVTSVAQWKKDAFNRRIENYKLNQEYEKEKQNIEDLRLLIEKGEVRNLPEKMVMFFEQIDFIRALFNRWKSKSFIINAVMLKWKDISRNTATSLYNESVNFFNLDNEIKVEAWANIYAERQDSLAALAREMNDIERASACMDKAAKYRGVGKEKPFDLPEGVLDKRPTLYTTRCSDVGIKKVPRYQLAAFIDNMDVSSVDKKNLYRDAQIPTDVDFEIFEEDGKDNS